VFLRVAMKRKVNKEKSNKDNIRESKKSKWIIYKLNCWRKFSIEILVSNVRFNNIVETDSSVK
jgi:hypothetical protein